MTLSPSEKQTLIGPLVVGCLLGAFCAYAVFAFASEYRLQNGDSIDTWQTAAEAVFAFFVAAVSTAGLLGVLPIAVHRWRAKGGGNV
jgi:Mg/Co/Ni transporter MgtE